MIGLGEMGMVGGHPVRRVGRDLYRLETDQHHVTGPAADVLDRIQRNQNDQRPPWPSGRPAW